MITIITIYITHDNPKSIEILKDQIKKTTISVLNIQLGQVSIIHENK